MIQLTDEQFKSVLKDVFRTPKFQEVKNRIMDQLTEKALMDAFADPEIRKIVQERADAYMQAHQHNAVPAEGKEPAEHKFIEISAKKITPKQAGGDQRVLKH
jgi:hypothetical protein